MTVSISSEAGKLRVIAGYESGHTIVFQKVNSKSAWQKVYKSQPHSQPGMSQPFKYAISGPDSEQYYHWTSYHARTIT